MTLSPKGTEIFYVIVFALVAGVFLGLGLVTGVPVLIRAGFWAISSILAYISWESYLQYKKLDNAENTRT